MTISRPLLYLASHSPRRRELLRQINVRFETLLLRSDLVRGSDVEEIPRDGEAPTDYVNRVTVDKARIGAVRARERGLAPGVVLAADTEVVIDGEALGKPRDAAAATRMLLRLSGRSHEVLSAVAVATSETRIDVRLTRSVVTLKELEPAELRRYVSSGEPLDKAGSYAIQGIGALFVTRIEGSYSAVMGLPLYETGELLRSSGFDIP
ncbi:MAG: septum formation inhibitor Maf [Rhodocyclaceae bacterium]|jgi:septum formation protein|nr:septum formation inhibitor Maf [Rhodocyclaceae bacterium]MCE2981132.1 Maf family nucleotide pyrophosphatase [Betaproteobacteria bacterium]MCA3075858.1 septum formation inhibitor Maf [Rhodocyclaceae bacterium]MCA3092012.1 septum formation inhibitor Maf [Rhodocyclaceae bacterium]MCA3095864.1 septum formation inhibitor Maf [Rhodocyclaceae bacterium]